MGSEEPIEYLSTFIPERCRPGGFSRKGCGDANVHIPFVGKRRKGGGQGPCLALLWIWMLAMGESMSQGSTDILLKTRKFKCEL